MNAGDDARCLEIWFCHQVKIRGRELELLVGDFDDGKWQAFLETPGVEDARMSDVSLLEVWDALCAPRRAPGDASLPPRALHVS